MRKYGKWVLTLGLLTATPGLTLAAGAKSQPEDKPAAAESKRAVKEDSQKASNQKVANEIARAMRAKRIQGDIAIEYKNGVAVLSGTVEDPALREKATDAVKKVSGVQRVDNRLVVAEPQRPVRTPADPRTPEAPNRVVSASHTASPFKADRVQQVNGELPAPTGNAQEVAEEIAAALTAANLSGYDIEIRYQNGVALLEGNVQTQAERALAQKVVSDIPSVRSVANRLNCAQEPAAAPGGPRGPQAGLYPAAYRQGEAMPAQPGMPPQPGMPMGPGVPMPPMYGHPGMGASQAVYNNPSVPDYAWPAYAQYPNSAAVSYPQQYSASAWPYIGPFYPYPQVPMGWRDATLRWDDGQWNLMFRTRTDKWWWYFNPKNW